MKIVNMSVELLDYMGGDSAVVDAARVSFGKEANQYSDEQNTKLINYLAKHGHWSPFAHSFLKFRIKAPVFVARQMVKHQVGLAWNEVSRRYVSDEPEFYKMAWRYAAPNVKQGSAGVLNPQTAAMADEVFWRAINHCFTAYETLLALGIAPEQARAALNLNSMTEWIWSGSLMAFARVCKLRLDPHAQAETGEVAQMIHDQVPKEFQYSWKALLE